MMNGFKRNSDLGIYLTCYLHVSHCTRLCTNLIIVRNGSFFQSLGRACEIR